MLANKLIPVGVLLSTLAVPVSAQKETATPRSLYDENCAVCHQADGGGVPFMQPELFGSARANGPKGSVIEMILFGSKAPGAGQSGFSNEMPAFDYLTNEEIAMIATYVRTNFENDGGAVGAADVQSYRK